MNPPDYHPLIGRFNEVINRAIEQKIFPGCGLGFIYRNRIKHILFYGKTTYEDQAPVLPRDALFDVASITKAIPTSSLALSLLDQSRISLDDQVYQWFPEYTGFDKRITLRHLLTYTLDFNLSLSAQKDLKPEDLLRNILTRKLHTPPGEKFLYCNATSIILGMLIERIWQKKLDQLAQDIFFKSLGMRNTTFHPTPLQREKCVPTEKDPWRNRILKGEIHDESAWVLRNIMIPGSAGLFTCVPDLMIFLEMLLCRGVYNSQRYFSEEIIRLMITNQIAASGESTGLGWELNQSRYMGKYCSSQTIGKTGFTGCVIIADLQKGSGFVLLSNYTWPTRKSNADLINAVRRDIADILLGTS